jgi:hypothetical protein
MKSKTTSAIPLSWRAALSCLLLLVAIAGCSDNHTTEAQTDTAALADGVIVVLPPRPPPPSHAPIWASYACATAGRPHS